MQWDNSPNAGFTRGTPWLTPPPSFKTHNVAAELKDPNSVLNFYRQLLALRRSNPALLDGDYIAINPDDPQVLSYVRRTANQSVLIVLNMSAAPQTVTVDLSSQGLASAKPHTLLSTMPSKGELDLAHFLLEPFAVYVGEVMK
jgi:alpha-glucosidase